MTNHEFAARLLQWRATRAEAEAPPPPSGAELLARARPWWERWPARLAERVARLTQLQVTYGVAQSDTVGTRQGVPVPLLLIDAEGERGGVARVLYLEVHDGRLRLRLELDAPPHESLHHMAEITFVSRLDAEALLSAAASRVHDREYSLDVALPERLALAWKTLRVRDAMPFRLIVDSADSPAPDRRRAG